MLSLELERLIIELEEELKKELEEELKKELEEGLDTHHSSCSGSLEKCTSSCPGTLEQVVMKEKTDMTHEMMSIEMYRNHEADLELNRRDQIQEYQERQEADKEMRVQVETRRRQGEEVLLRGGTVSHLVKAFTALHQPLGSCSAKV